MMIKNRYSLFKRRYALIGSKARRRLGKSPDEGRLTLSSVLVTITSLALMNFNYIVAKVDLPYVEWLFSALCLALFLLAIYMEFRRRAPRTCWTRAVWASAVIALVWSLFPWFIYWIDDMEDMELVRNFSIASVCMWVVCLGCYLRLRYIRRRSRATIAMMRMRRARRRGY